MGYDPGLTAAHDRCSQTSMGCYYTQFPGELVKLTTNQEYEKMPREICDLILNPKHLPWAQELAQLGMLGARKKKKKN